MIEDVALKYECKMSYFGNKKQSYREIASRCPDKEFPSKEYYLEQLRKLAQNI